MRFWKVEWLLISRMVERKLCFRRMNLVTVLGSDWSGGDGSWEVIEQAFVLVQIWSSKGHWARTDTIGWRSRKSFWTFLQSQLLVVKSKMVFIAYREAASLEQSPLVTPAAILKITLSPLAMGREFGWKCTPPAQLLSLKICSDGPRVKEQLFFLALDDTQGGVE